MHCIQYIYDVQIVHKWEESGQCENNFVRKYLCIHHTHYSNADRTNNAWLCCGVVWRGAFRKWYVYRANKRFSSHFTLHTSHYYCTSFCIGGFRVLSFLCSSSFLSFLFFCSPFGRTRGGRARRASKVDATAQRVTENRCDFHARRFRARLQNSKCVELAIDKIPLWWIRRGEMAWKCWAEWRERRDRWDKYIVMGSLFYRYHCHCRSLSLMPPLEPAGDQTHKQ